MSRERVENITFLFPSFVSSSPQYYGPHPLMRASPYPVPPPPTLPPLTHQQHPGPPHPGQPPVLHPAHSASSLGGAGTAAQPPMLPPGAYGAHMALPAPQPQQPQHQQQPQQPHQVAGAAAAAAAGPGGGYTLPPTAAYFPMSVYSSGPMSAPQQSKILEAAAAEQQEAGMTQPNTPDLLIHRRQVRQKRKALRALKCAAEGLRVSWCEMAQF